MQRFLAVALLVLVLGGCAASKPVEAFENGRPIFKPEKYFAGRTHSWGVFEDRHGKPTKLIATQTRGAWDGSTLKFEQDLQIEGSKPAHRSWVIHKIDAHHYTATGTGIVGEANGVAYGNVFHLDFTLDAVPGNPLAHVHMSQWMYLQADGITMVNRDTLTKDGLILAEITEQFHKEGFRK